MENKDLILVLINRLGYAYKGYAERPGIAEAIVELIKDGLVFEDEEGGEIVYKLTVSGKLRLLKLGGI